MNTRGRSRPSTSPSRNSSARRPRQVAAQCLGITVDNRCCLLTCTQTVGAPSAAYVTLCSFFFFFPISKYSESVMPLTPTRPTVAVAARYFLLSFPPHVAPRCKMFQATAVPQFSSRAFSPHCHSLNFAMPHLVEYRAALLQPRLARLEQSTVATHRSMLARLPTIRP